VYDGGCVLGEHLQRERGDSADNDNGFDAVAVEKSQFLLRLAPRTRRPESNTAECLVGCLEGLLTQVQESKGMSAPGPTAQSLAAHVDARAWTFVQALPVLTLHPPLSTPSSLAQDSKSLAPACGTWKALPAPSLKPSLCEPAASTPERAGQRRP
jgi:hypothetical protein